MQSVEKNRRRNTDTSDRQVGDAQKEILPTEPRDGRQNDVLLTVEGGHREVWVRGESRETERTHASGQQTVRYPRAFFH